MIILRANRANRALAIKDVSVAFLQSRRYPDGMVKYISFKHPQTGVWHYFKQTGPIYGEPSAPVRWECTVTDWLQEIGFTRGSNEPCGFHHQVRDLVELLYVDDNLADGDKADIDWLNAQYDQRFKCKEVEMLTPETPLDYLGVEVEQDSEYTYIHMSKYIEHCLQYMELEGLTAHPNPIIKEIDDESPPLKPALRQRFLTLLGMVGWLVNTCRPDVAYPHSRIGQHTADPTEAAYAAIVHVFRYLKGTKRYGLAQLLNTHPKTLNVLTMDHVNNAHGWRFYADTDFASNAEKQNKRRSQNGMVTMLGKACVQYYSKVSSVAFAHPDIKMAHPDTSSAAAEVYGAGNASHAMLQMSYIADELRIPFPKPMILEVDNTAAEAFANNTAYKTTLKHIDVRQEWIQTLRNANILRVQHVPSADNLADLMTKILPTVTFVRLRDQMMMNVPIRQAP